MEVERKPCESCMEYKGIAVEAEYVINPYIEDVGNEIVWEWMCDSCYDAAVGDI